LEKKKRRMFCMKMVENKNTLIKKADTF